MEKNVVICRNILEKRSDKRSRTISSDSEDFGLTIDLDSDYHENNQEVEHNTINKNNAEITFVNDDDLSIGCEENDRSVNFFIKVEKQIKKAEKPVHKSANASSVSKKYKHNFETSFKPSENEKQSSTLKGKERNRNKDIKIKSPSKICPKCNFKSDLNKNLYEHLKICLNQDNFECLDCPFQTKLIECLTQHEECHSLENAAFKCTLCTFGCNNLADHHKHLRMHFKDNKIETKDIFQCPLCPFTKSYLRTLAHFRVHAKPHKHLKDVIECPVCGMKSKKHSFGRHSKFHISVDAGFNTKWKKCGNAWRDVNRKERYSCDKPVDEASEKEEDNDADGLI